MKNNTKKILVIVLTILILLSLISINDFVYTADIGNKNIELKNKLQNIKNGQAPTYRDYSSTAANNQGSHSDNLTNETINGTTITGYTNGYSNDTIKYERLANGGVYRGGNGKSIFQGDSYHSKTDIDNDIEDFASVLPYGTIFINTDKMKDWNTPSNFKIEIKDNRFKWSGRDSLVDAAGNKPTAEFKKENQPHPESAICYYGYLHSYLNYDNNSNELNNTRAYKSKIYTGKYNGVKVENGTNVIEAQSGDYLYKITYLNAAVLSDGSKADVVIQVSKVELESTVTTTEPVPIGLQSSAYMQVHSNYVKDNGTTRYIPKDVTFDAYSQKQGVTYSRTIRNAVGANTTLKIQVQKNGQAVNGEFCYGVKDLDVPSYESFWGRRPSDTDKWETGLEFYKYGEGMQINYGALSYAVTPYYDHSSEKNDVSKGKIPIDILRKGKNKTLYNSPLRIEGSGNDNKANGVRFVTSATQKVRDNGESTAGNYTGGANFSNGINYSGDFMSKNGFDRDNLTYATFNSSNIQNWGANRQDGNTYDTGFAVLLDAKGSELVWSGSQHTSATVDTKLFDNSVFNRVELTHGTGGGIYVEEYDINTLNPIMREETVVIGSGDKTVVTIVPEDGYMVSSFIIDNTEYKVTTDTSGRTIIKSGNNTYTFNNNKASINNTDIAIEKNSDGSYDITLSMVTEDRTVHVDFEADYYFTKEWKGTVDNNAKLYLTATPYFINNSGNLEKYTGYTPVEFIVSKSDAYKTEGGKWYFKYPSRGDESKSWAALPIERTASNHKENHIERLYWFIKEDEAKLSKWELEKYSNNDVRIPAVVTNNTYHTTQWYKDAVKNNVNATSKIKAVNDSAYMSVFEDGGGIINKEIIIYNDLTIAKKVTGNMGDLDKEFEITVKLYNGETNVTSDITIVDTDGRTKNISATNSEYKIKLKHNDKVVIKNIVQGYKYSISETDTDYEESYKIEKTNETNTSKKTISEENENTITKQTLNEDQTVTFFNNKDLAISTGVFNNNEIPFGILLAIGVIGILIIIRSSMIIIGNSKKRKN